MAEDQDKQQKPKTTLIKHRKEEPKKEAAPPASEAPPAAAEGDKTEKKKVRVVVKRKPKPQPSINPETGVPTEGPARTPGSSDSDDTRAKSPTDRPAVERTRLQSEDERRPGSPTGRDSGTTPPSGDRFRREPTGRPEGGPRPPQDRDRGGYAGSSDRPSGGYADRGRPPQRSGTGTGGGYPPRPGGDRGPSGPGQRGPQARTGGPGAPRSTTGGGFRPGGSGPARPGGPGRPGGSGPGRPPGPGGRGPGGGSGAPPSPTDRGVQQKRPPRGRGRKGDNYKKDRYQEKQISFKNKKPIPKINPVPKEIDIMEVITVSDLARKMNLKASDLIGKLMSMGMMVTINQQIDAETAEILAAEYDCKVRIVSLYDETLIETPKDEESDLKPRSPIITVMGHVDHGKTKLLDAIRTTDVVAGESGGITQHIGAYQVVTPQGKLTFLDTPGHEAFTLMRSRGAQVTDFVILVVAANDGVMPQTVEAINHAREAKVPIIVAINKIDLPEANPDRVKQQLSEHDLIPEDWGGSTLYCEISALKREGIEELLETIILQTEVMELKANHDAPAEGKVIESRIDPGRGTVSTVLIERGTLRVGDSFIAGIFPGKVRAMFNDRGERVEEATPSMPVEILGFTGVPDAGNPFQVTESEKYARQIGNKRQELRKVEEAKNVKKITLDNLYDSIQAGAIQELKVIIKGDVHGSVEALQSTLEKLSTAEIRLVAIHSSAGAINENDVMLAAASNAIIVGFHVRPTPRAQAVAEQEKVEIRKYNIIYDAVEDIRSAMEGMLSPDIKEEALGTVEVRETFKVPKIGVIAGCYVTSGKVRRGAMAHVIRDGIELHTGKISSLRRFKDDAREVDSGYECGVGIEKFTDLKQGDIIEVFEMKEVAKKLGAPLSDKKEEKKAPKDKS